MSDVTSKTEFRVHRLKLGKRGDVDYEFTGLAFGLKKNAVAEAKRIRKEHGGAIVERVFVMQVSSIEMVLD